MVAAITRRARGGSIASVDALATYKCIRSDLEADYQAIEMTERLLSRAMTLAEKHGKPLLASSEAFMRGDVKRLQFYIIA